MFQADALITSVPAPPSIVQSQARARHRPSLRMVPKNGRRNLRGGRPSPPRDYHGQRRGQRSLSFSKGYSSDRQFIMMSVDLSYIPAGHLPDKALCTSFGSPQRTRVDLGDSGNSATRACHRDERCKLGRVAESLHFKNPDLIMSDQMCGFLLRPFPSESERFLGDQSMIDPQGS